MPSRILRRNVNASPSNWWLRYPNTGNANNEYNVNTTGSYNNNNANNSYGFSPDCSETDKQNTFETSRSKGCSVEAYAKTRRVMLPDT